MTIIKYRTGYAFDDKPIAKVECLKETDHSVFIDAGAYGQTHHSKNCNAFQYHDSYSQARLFLLDKCMRDVNKLKQQLACAKEALEDATKLPEVEP